MTTPGLVKSYHRSHCTYICYIWEPYKGWFILGKQLGLFLVEPWNDEGLIVKSILLLEESLHRVTDPGSQSTPPTHLVRVVVLFQRL